MITAMHYTEEQKRQWWAAVSAKGRSWYVWHYGVLRWGLPVCAIWTAYMLLLGPRTHRLAPWEIIAVIMFSVVGWTFGGYLFGRWMWWTFDRKYGR